MLLSQIENSLGLPERVIRAIARKANHAYKAYRIKKRDGKYRVIHHPSKELKALQRWLVHNVVTELPVHSAALAYRTRLSIANNAREHVRSRYLLRMDFQDFFPSITDKDVKMYLENAEFPRLQGWTTEDIDLFATIVCRDGRLTIGAPTSPGLLNAVCFNVDHQLESAARGREVVYTRYADDLFFSTVHPDVLKDFPQAVDSIVKKIGCPGALVINESKTRHSSKRGRRQVTGLVLKSDEAVGIGRHRKRYIRSLVHKFDSLNPVERRRLAGLIAFARSIEPDFMNALILKFGLERISEAQRMNQA
jgi:RNA-directed DNA polymerase